MPLDKRRWTTRAQHDWLVARFPSYREAQARHRYDQFWPTFFQEWFAEFPAPEPGSDDPTDSEHESDSDSEQTDGESRPLSSKRKRRQVKSKQNKASALAPAIPLTFEEKQLKKKGRIIRLTKERLKRHMRRHCAVTKRPRTIGSSTSSFYGAPAKSHRRLQETEVYSKLYYKTRIESAARERLENLEPGTKPIATVKTVTKELWDNEDWETKRAVAEVVAKAEAVSIKPGEGSQRTPQQYQDAIDEFPDYLEDVMRSIVRLTGFSMSVVFGGPIPNAGGAISSACVHMGKNELGNTFGDAYTDFQQNTVDPFHKFLRSVYPAATRASRSLSTNSKGAESPDFDKLEALDEPRDAGELHDTVDVAVVGSEIQAANENVSAFDEVPDVPATAGSSSATDVHPNVAESPKPILTDRDVSPLADITNDMTMAHRTASVPPFVTPRHQRKTHFIYGATPPEVGIDQQSRSFSNTPISSDRAITPIKLPSTGILTMKEMGERAMAEHDVAIAEHVVLRNASQPNQSIRPAYLRALDERAAAALLAPPVPSPTPAYLRASPSPTLIAPREVLKRKAPTTEVLAATEETSRRVRRLTDFGVQHEKDMEAKKAKAAKASLKKAEHVKANEASAKGTKKTARGKKGRK